MCHTHEERSDNNNNGSLKAATQRVLSPPVNNLAKISRRSLRLTGVTRGRRAQRPGHPLPVATNKYIAYELWYFYFKKTKFMDLKGKYKSKYEHFINKVSKFDDREIVPSKPLCSGENPMY